MLDAANLVSRELDVSRVWIYNSIIYHLQTVKFVGWQNLPERQAPKSRPKTNEDPIPKSIHRGQRQTASLAPTRVEHLIGRWIGYEILKLSQAKGCFAESFFARASLTVGSPPIALSMASFVAL